MPHQCVSPPTPPACASSGAECDKLWLRYYDVYDLYARQRCDSGGTELDCPNAVGGVASILDSGAEDQSRRGSGGAVTFVQSVKDSGPSCVSDAKDPTIRGFAGRSGSEFLPILLHRDGQEDGFKECTETRSESVDVIGRVEPFEVSGVDVECKGSRAWGRWHSSNVKKRNRRKNGSTFVTKQLKMQGDWRAGSCAVDSDYNSDCKSSERGFFSNCDDVVRKDLRESRARMLIAQNNLRAQKAQKDLESMNSVQGIVQQMLDVTTSVAKLQKHTADEAVHGWARTVASTMAKSITESSSHVPTLESVGFGASGLKSTDGEVLDPVRVAAYDRDMKYVEDCFASMDGYSEEDYKLAVHRVKLDFPDVAYTKVQREVAASKSVAVERLLELGVSYDKIQLALYPEECGDL